MILPTDVVRLEADARGTCSLEECDSVWEDTEHIWDCQTRTLNRYLREIATVDNSRLIMKKEFEARNHDKTETIIDNDIYDNFKVSNNISSLKYK